MSTFNLDMTTDQIVAEFYIEGTTGGAAVGNIAVINLDGNVGNVLRGDGTWGVGGGGGSANVAGANGELQYNANGNLGGVSGVTTNGTRLVVNGAANLSITGGSNGQMLTTDGSGNLRFATVPGYVNIPRIELVSPNVSTQNASFTDPRFAYFANIDQMSIFINGVLSDPSQYTLVGNTLTYTGWLGPETGLDVLSQTVAVGNTDMSGNINAFDITCNSISGDGSRLTNLNAGTKISNTTTSVNTFSTGNVDITINGADIVNIDSGGMEVNGKLVPAANITYDLGSPTRRWRDLYLSNNTINLGNVALSADANGLSIGGETALTAPGGVLTVDSVVAGNLSGNHLSGNGSGITYISGANVYGAVDDAVYAGVAGVAGVANLVEYSNIANIGNIASVNLDGNVSNVLNGSGGWIKFNAAQGNTGELQYNSGGNVAATNRMRYDGTALIVSSDSLSQIYAVKYSNSSATTFSSARARGTKASPVALAINDTLNLATGFFYTGNGINSIDGVTGWASTVTAITSKVIGLPTGPGLPPATQIAFITTSNTSNTTTSLLSVDSSNVFIAGSASNSNVYIGASSANVRTTINASGNSSLVINTTPPATSTSQGSVGQVAFDGSYIYYCASANTWVRAPLSTW